MNFKACLIMLFILANINITSASDLSPIELNHKYTIFVGSGVHYNYPKEGGFQYIQIRQVSLNVNNLKNRWVEFRINKNGDTVRIERCYNYDYCQIGNIKVQVLNIFNGKEASAVQLKILKVY